MAHNPQRFVAPRARLWLRLGKPIPGSTAPPPSPRKPAPFRPMIWLPGRHHCHSECKCDPLGVHVHAAAAAAITTTTTTITTTNNVWIDNASSKRLISMIAIYIPRYPFSCIPPGGQAFRFPSAFQVACSCRFCVTTAPKQSLLQAEKESVRQCAFTDYVYRATELIQHIKQILLIDPCST